MKVGKSAAVSFLFICIFVLSAALYLQFASFIFEYKSEFENAANYHDHSVYLLNFESDVENANIFLQLGNDLGIAYIYKAITSVLPVLITKDMVLGSFIINLAFLLVLYFLYAKICDLLELGILGKLSFFANTSLLYFTQLINKDIMTMVIFLLATYLAIKRNYIFIIAMIPLSLYVRLQLGIFLLCLIFLISASRLRTRILLVYFITSLVAAYIMILHPFIGEESLGDGLSSYVVSFNNTYPIGYLLFNPLRVVQFIIDLYYSFDINNVNGSIDVARVLRIPQVILLTYLIPSYYRLIRNWRVYKNTCCRDLVAFLAAFLCTWLMNPTVNARYVILASPIIVLLGLYVKKSEQSHAY